MRWLGRLCSISRFPPRCAGCGDDHRRMPHQFCADCWQQVDWLGQGGCDRCGLPLEATEADRAARCLAQPPLIERSRAAVAYGEHCAVAGAAAEIWAQGGACRDDGAATCAPLVDAAPGTILVPVPLHRTPIVVARASTSRR